MTITGPGGFEFNTSHATAVGTRRRTGTDRFYVATDIISGISIGAEYQCSASNGGSTPSSDSIVLTGVCEWLGTRVVNPILCPPPQTCNDIII